VPGDQITWTATITAPGGIRTQAFVVTATADHSGSLSNSVHVSTEEGIERSDSVAVDANWRAYLPLILRTGS
jgi:hypothetical protein